MGAKSVVWVSHWFHSAWKWRMGLMIWHHDCKKFAFSNAQDLKSPTPPLQIRFWYLSAYKESPWVELSTGKILSEKDEIFAEKWLVECSVSVWGWRSTTLFPVMSTQQGLWLSWVKWVHWVKGIWNLESIKIYFKVKAQIRWSRFVDPRNWHFALFSWRGHTHTMALMRPLQTPEQTKQPHELNHTDLENPDLENLIIKYFTVGSQGISTKMGPKWGSIFPVCLPACQDARWQRYHLAWHCNNSG